MPLPLPVVRLVEALRGLPGVGPRSAERLALHIALGPELDASLLAQAITDSKSKVRLCERCGGLSEEELCPLCSDDQRDTSLVCVVEKPTDILLFEKAGSYRGLFHVLGGKISPVRGVEPEDLRIKELLARAQSGQIKEIIVALPSDVEGDATCYYLAKLLEGKGITLSRLAQGLPAGGGLEYADQVTLGRALQGRQSIQ